MRNHFVKNPEELLESLIEFNKEAIYQRKMIGSNFKFFIHCVVDEQHMFGLSKFCAFRNIIAEDYLKGIRHKEGGTTTQKHLVRITKQHWIPYNALDQSTQAAFDEWIGITFPAFKNYDNLGFISLAATNLSNRSNRKAISQDELDSILENRKLIGDVGEQIAILYEQDRLMKLGAKQPNKYLTHTSKSNAGAGFDIYSDYDNDVRFIEVKSSIANHDCIYITKNEIETFEANGKSSYIYLVSITDLKNRIGTVREVTAIDMLGNLEPVLFKIKHKH